MRVIETQDYYHMSRTAANIISAQIIIKPNSVIGLATGSTPIGTYEQLIRWYEKGDLDFSNVTTINLDEYKGIAPDNEQSYRYFMNKHLFDRINIDKKNTYVPDGLEMDSDKACSDYNRIIRESGGYKCGRAGRCAARRPLFHSAPRVWRQKADPRRILRRNRRGFRRFCPSEPRKRKAAFPARADGRTARRNRSETDHI